MADNVAITAGAGTLVATDELTINSIAVQVQRMKLSLGRDGVFTADQAGRDLGSGDGASYVDLRPNVVRIQATPTVSTSPAYTAKDAVGGLMTFANAVRASGGTGRVEAVELLDKGQQMKDLDLLFFDRSITAPTDNAVFAPTDTEGGYYLGHVAIGAGYYADLSTNSVATVNNVGLAFALNGTDLFAVAVSRSSTGPTYTSTTDLVWSLVISRD